jgi:hypothetical protein
MFGTAPTCRAREASLLPVAAKLHKRQTQMLYTIAVILIILWLLGLVTSYTMGGFIHILLVIAIVVILVNLITGRKSL